jgi:hypothetical protein
VRRLARPCDSLRAEPAFASPALFWSDVTIPPIVENLAAYASIATLPSLLISYLAWIRKPGFGRTVIMSTAGIIAIAAYTLDISDRFGWINLSAKGEIVPAWGANNGTFLMNVQSQQLAAYKDTFRMMEILEIPYADTDRMTDTNIEKSAAFTITGDSTVVALRLSSPMHLNVRGPSTAKAGDTITILVSFNLVIVPQSVSGDQIRSLSDVERLGGKIITTRASNAIS